MSPLSSAPLRHDEAVAARMRLQAADVEIHLLGQAEALAADLDEIAGRDERFEVPLERRPLVARDLEELQELAHAGRMVHAFAHQRENLITRKHWNRTSVASVLCGGPCQANRNTWRSPTLVPVGPVLMRSPSAAKNAWELLSSR